MNIAVVLILLAANALAVSQCRGDTEVDRVTQNLRTSLLEKAQWPSDSAKKPEEFFASLRSDGSWADQDYADRDRLHWKAIDHLPRLESIVRAYYQPGNSLSRKPVVLNASLKSLKFWLDKDPKNENWWHNDIGVPSFIGEILILLGPDAPADLRDRGMEIMKRANWTKQTGANLTDETRIQVMRGCLSESVDLISQAYERSWQEVRLAGENEDGMQVDHSFHQHGPLLYDEGYGAVFVHDIVQFVQYAEGTRFQIPTAQKELFDTYLMEGPLWMVRGGKWDFSACGRGIVRPRRIEGSDAAAIEQMATLDPTLDQTKLQLIASKLTESDDKSEPNGNRQYWLSDYMVNRRPNYFASARMYSTRTLNTDGLTNGENRKSHHMADGATCFMVTGDEYFDIFPVWDWLRIPGTTIEQNTPLVPEQVSHKGKNTFAGEVSDGLYGCSSMELETGKLHAIKSWFFFDKEIVCLGTDINCPTSNHVFTSFNQCNLIGPVQSSSGAISQGDRDLKNQRWIWHDSIGYLFPTPTNVHLKNDLQSGAWSDIGTGPEKDVIKDVFGLWIDHGSEVSGGSYQYIVLPGTTAQQTNEEAEHLPLKILSDTPAVQAVWHEQLNLLEAAFHTACELKAEGMEISVNQPCLLMIKNVGGKMQLTLSSPQNITGPINVSIRQQNGSPKRVQVELPTGLMSGSSVVRQITN